MKVKNDNMNPESVKSLKEFKKKRIESNIKLHKIFLAMIIIINIILIIFIIAYKTKISDIKSKSKKSSKDIKESADYLTSVNDEILHKLVNIFALSINTFGNLHFSMLFDTSEEVNMVKNFITSFTKIEEPELILIYQGVSDTDETSILLELIKYCQNTIIIIETTTEEKFGFFFKEQIYPNDLGYFESDNNNCFIFSFQEKEKYDCDGKNIFFEINKDNLFSIGNGDIEIAFGFDSNGGNINFPFKSFNIPENKESIFKKINGHFDIQDIEIYFINDN